MKRSFTRSIISCVTVGMLSMGLSAQADTLTRQNGAPVGDNQNSQTAGPWGPVLLLSLIHISEPTRPY